MGGLSIPVKSLISLLLLGCLLWAAVSAGCMETSPTPATPTPTPAPASTYTIYPPVGPKPAFSSSITSLQKRMRSDGSCYWTVAGSVTNEGDGTARNAAIRFMLIDDEASMIRATETVFVPRFPAGETKAFTVDALPGECDRQYHAEIEVTCDIP